ncbi:MAG: hypothetical protein ABUK01_18960, partial [Leptospirales bacterium]
GHFVFVTFLASVILGAIYGAVIGGVTGMLVAGMTSGWDANSMKQGLLNGAVSGAILGGVSAGIGYLASIGGGGSYTGYGDYKVHAVSNQGAEMGTKTLTGTYSSVTNQMADIYTGVRELGHVWAEVTTPMANPTLISTLGGSSGVVAGNISAVNVTENAAGKKAEIKKELNKLETDINTIYSIINNYTTSTSTNVNNAMTENEYRTINNAIERIATTSLEYKGFIFNSQYSFTEMVHTVLTKRYSPHPDLPNSILLEDIAFLYRYRNIKDAKMLTGGELGNAKLSVLIKLKNLKGHLKAMKESFGVK